MNYKYCQKCGKKIPLGSGFCPFCGSRQSKKSNYVNHLFGGAPNRTQHLSSQPTPPPMLTSTDIEMLIINGICAFLQFLYSIQALIPVMNASTELEICIMAAILGVIISGIDGYENFQNRLPIWCPILGILGNLIGPGLAYTTGLNVICVLGTIILGFSIYLMYREIR